MTKSVFCSGIAGIGIAVFLAASLGGMSARQLTGEAQRRAGALRFSQDKTE